MADQPQDSSASTAETPVGGAASGGVQVQAAPRDRVKAGLLAGRSIKGLSRDLGVARPTVQGHARRLLEAGELVKREGRFFPGPSGGVQPGRITPHHAPVPLAITPEAAPPRLDTATDGKRIFRLTRPPGYVSELPGFVWSKPKGRSRSQLLHKVEFAHNGATWNLWLEQGIKAGKWSAWVGQVSPPPRFEDFQRPGEDPDDAFDRLTVQTVVAWAIKANVGLEPIPRRARRVSVTYQGIVENATWRSPSSDADSTPPDPSGRLALEVRGGELQDFVNNGPEMKRAFDAAIGRVDRAMVTIAERMAEHLEMEARQVTGDHLRGIALSPSTKRSLSPDSGVDVS